MKHTTNTSKVLILAIALLGMSISALQAQTGRVGINSDTPKSTLEIVAKTTNGSQAEGLLIPRLTGDQIASIDPSSISIETSTMLYATAAVSSATPAAHVSKITAAGYYYYDGTEWVPFGSSSTADNIYTTDGTLTSTRTLTQNNQNLTFATGTGRTIINGIFEMKGRVYAKTREVATILPSTVLDDDFSLVHTSTNSIQLPDPSLAINVGRLLCITNQSSTARSITLNPPLNNSTLYAGKGFLMISDGTHWQVIGGSY